MPTYYIQMNANGDGWTLYRASGITMQVKRLSAAKFLMESTGAVLIVLDQNGYRLN